MTSFPDHFSGHASEYATYRPRYPDAFFQKLAELAPSRSTAWDVGCGNGQASVALARYFERVVATDASGQQIASAEIHPRVQYSVAPAENSGLPECSIDLIVVAQALHWFDPDAFFIEVRRVARPGAVIAAIAYELNAIEPPIDQIVRRFYKGDIGPYWPPERARIETAYRNIAWPFSKLELPTFEMTATWTLAEFLGYLGTWSAVARFRKATARNPLPAVATELAEVWGDPNVAKAVSWPLVVLAGRVDEHHA